MTAARFPVARPPLLQDPAIAAVLDALPRARLVGGAVRDALAGLPLADIDLATPDAPAAVTAALAAAGIKVVPTGLAHGTVTAVAGGRPIEITTLRRDVATDGRHAVVAFTDDWHEDAARRDFTINAMSMARDGVVEDWFGGREDLAAGRVRFVGEPARRITEDYLRALRFFRFQARYGRGAPDQAALAAIAAAVPGLPRLSAERVWAELKRILAAPDPAAAVALMAATGVLAAVLPEATDAAALARLVAAGAPADPLLRLAALAPGFGAEAAARLRLSGAEAERLAAAAGPVPAPCDDDAALRRALADAPHDALADRAWLAEARGASRDEVGDTAGDAAGGKAGGWAGLRARLAATDRPVFPLAGADVVAAGVEPGPRVGAVLGALRAAWLAKGCMGDRAAWREALARHLAGG